jgi:NitT/TauT family transport system permease protein
MLFIGVLGMGSSVLVKKIGDLFMPWYHMQRKKHEPARPR